MNGAATFGGELWRGANGFCGAQLGFFGGLALGETMTSAMAAFGIAVGVTSLICYLLMTRVQNSKRNLRSSGDSSTPDGGTAGPSPTGSAAAIRRWIVRAIRATSAQAIVAEAVAAREVEAEAINALRPAKKHQSFDLALLWQIYSRRCFPPICLLQYGHR
jgi:hypothetical protein